MNTVIIPKKLMQGDDLVIIPRKKYKEFLGWEKIVEKRLAEESDTDLAIEIYKREKKYGKLKIIKSLKDIG